MSMQKAKGSEIWHCTKCGHNYTTDGPPEFLHKEDDDSLHGYKRDPDGITWPIYTMEYMYGQFPHNVNLLGDTEGMPIREGICTACKQDAWEKECNRLAKSAPKNKGVMGGEWLQTLKKLNDFDPATPNADIPWLVRYHAPKRIPRSEWPEPCRSCHEQCCCFCLKVRGD